MKCKKTGVFIREKYFSSDLRSTLLGLVVLDGLYKLTFRRFDYAQLINHLMAQWVDMEALENENHAYLLRCFTLWVRSDKSVVSN